MLSMRSRMKGIIYIFFIYIHYYYLSQSSISSFSVLHALNENNERYIEEKEKTLRSQAIREILTTEVTYLQQLETLTEVLFNIHIFLLQ